MTTHRIGTRQEWLSARLDLLEVEKELTRRSDEVARQRQELPWVPVDKEYRFDTDDGQVHNASWCPRTARPYASADSRSGQLFGLNGNLVTRAPWLAHGVDTEGASGYPRLTMRYTGS